MCCDALQCCRRSLTSAFASMLSQDNAMCKCCRLTHQHNAAGGWSCQMIDGAIHTQVRVWVPAAVMRRAQATMVQGTGPGSSGLMLKLTSSFHESSVPLQVNSMLLCSVCSIGQSL